MVSQKAFISDHKEAESGVVVEIVVENPSEVILYFRRPDT